MVLGEILGRESLFKPADDAPSVFVFGPSRTVARGRSGEFGANSLGLSWFFRSG